MPAQFAVVTDSTSDIPPALAQEHRVFVTPLHVIWGGENLRDGIDISRQQFYHRLRTDPVHPSTSQPSPADFVATFNRAREATGTPAIIAVTISGALSGTFASAQQAAEQVDFPVHVVDSRTTSGALGLHALQVAADRDAGVSFAEAVTRAESYSTRTLAMLTVDTLTYMERSGRVSGVQRRIGNILHLKPIIEVIDGQMQLRESVRGRKRSLERLLELFGARIDPARPLHVAVLHGDAPDVADDIAARIAARWQPVFAMTGPGSAAVGVHTGPGAIGLTLFQ
ncbi:MAG: DegV family protein [Anaerolineae bacterium]|nr:DegV family protein [Anaerolineae bacterium]